MKSIYMNIFKFNLLAVFMLLVLNISGQNPTYFEFADSVQNWVDTRVANAKNDIKEKVEMPFVVRCTGWGCICPDHYIGVSSSTQEGPWIAPISPKKCPVVDRNGYSLIVTGYFTGKIIELDYRDKEGEPAEWLYKVPEFKILSWKENDLGYDVFAPRVIK
jgi:hypothetical protein